MEILDEGLRRELLITLESKLNTNLKFSEQKKFSDFERILTDTGEDLDSLKTALQYIQDMLNVYGMKIWYDEYNKLISAYIDVEWNYIRSKELPDEALKWANSENQDDAKAVDVSTHKLKASENALTFIGRTINAFVTLCDPETTSYVKKSLSFYSTDKKSILVSMNTFLKINRCIGVNGLSGIDKLLSFMIVGEHYNIQKIFKAIYTKDRDGLRTDSSELGMLNNIVQDIDKIYLGAKKRLSKEFDQILDSLEKIGLYTILRDMCLRELNLSAKAETQKVYLLIENMNDCMVNEVQKGRYDNLQKEEIIAESTFLNQLSDLSVRLGFSDPTNKIYFRPASLEHVPLMMAFTLYHSIEYAAYNKEISSIERVPKGRRDPLRYLIGASIFMNQYNDNANRLLHNFMSQYIQSTLTGMSTDASNAMFNNSYIFCQYYSEFIKILEIDTNV